MSFPLTDGSSPFVAFHVWHLGYEEMVTDVIDVPGISSKRIDVDSKAMRKLKPNQELVSVVEQTTIGAAMSINLVISIRMLFGD